MKQQVTFLLGVLLISCICNAQYSNVFDTVRSTLIEMNQLYQQQRHAEEFASIIFLNLVLEQVSQSCPLPYSTYQSSVLCESSLDTLQSYISNIDSNTSEQDLNTTLSIIAPLVSSISMTCSSSDFMQMTNLGDKDKYCAVCTVVMQITNNYIIYKKGDITQFVEQVCNYLPKQFQATCVNIIKLWGPSIIYYNLKSYNADVICRKLKMCNNPQCNLNPPFAAQLDDEDPELNNIMNDYDIAPWQWVQDLINKFADKHLPIVDLDGDYHSTIPTFRGTNWRGYDCNDLDPNVYPGRKTYSGSDKGYDFNCNGISGVDPNTNVPYKQEFCENTGQIGIAVVGDSAGAHFSIPEDWMNVTEFNGKQYNNLLYLASDELDWPQNGGYTGKNPNSATSPLQSVYKNLVQRNRCNYNDFQNVAVNGGASGNTKGNIKALRRNNNTDYPLLVFLELIGNDVCKKSFNSMTTPEEFKQNILDILEYLDTVVPAGSHVWMFGLAQGTLLYDTMWNLTHPLNVTYERVYDFLNCLNISPCWGWLNSNDTVRNITQQHAEALNQVYRDIVSEGYQFNNFDYVYYDFPVQEIMDKYTAAGGAPSDLIEPVDGFHPDQRFNAYLADWMWNKLETEHPSWIGAVNPFNEYIDQLLQQENMEPIF